MGYYAHRNFIDEMGLVQRDVATHVADGDFTWVFTHYLPDYVILSPYSLCECASQAWFNSAYRLVTQLDLPGTYPLRIYARRA